MRVETLFLDPEHAPHVAKPRTWCWDASCLPRCADIQGHDGAKQDESQGGMGLKRSLELAQSASDFTSFSSDDACVPAENQNWDANWPAYVEHG